ncbi:tRNA synthetase class II (F) [Anaerobacterium chartisolvens]|uniref:tRNA synthetase class II (F) n=1 Tax=Anaerobacterium chartisolvens TaxID=1297424 RepID=A0A369BHI5_9FIRM|nr:hypothetical protein [Anaerobacterium chartisolvens]RCX21020.1 tRNA synthetase class II (F) [Anaerobacterium chartisolvens]
MNSSYGKKNPLNTVINMMYDFFKRLGFNIVFGKEIETYYNNFTALNIEDKSFITLDDATFYIEDDLLLRSHLSPIWIRQMSKKSYPLAFIEIGKVYRCDSKGSLFRPMFYQAEGVILDKGIHFSDLKGIMELFVQYIFNCKREMTFQPYWHAFTCPSVKIDVSCICNYDTNCPYCRGNNLVNICTAGMIDRNILNECGYDSDISGICFGLGPSRLIQLVENVSNIQELYENNIVCF